MNRQNLGVLVEYLPEGEATVAPPIGMGLIPLTFAPDPDYDGRKIVPFPSEQLAEEFMRPYNLGHTEPVFAIAVDLIDAGTARIIRRTCETIFAELLNQMAIGSSPAEIVAGLREKWALEDAGQAEGEVQPQEPGPPTPEVQEQPPEGEQPPDPPPPEA